jgi:hypothetical protein
MVNSGTPNRESKRVYPVHAIALVVLAWLGFFVLLVSGAITLMLVVVTMPAYAAALVGYSGLLSAAHEYARARAYSVSVRRESSLRALFHPRSA